ncbi:hypothetical protein F5Y11DRAFT_367117 [Daldinia sp. FL1419]|nr:hypothetical protein F5Y11DRAFT_367117 [Daldinia sp. FL1419]
MSEYLARCDFDVLSDNEEYEFNFEELDRTYPNRQGEQGLPLQHLPGPNAWTTNQMYAGTSQTSGGPITQPEHNIPNTESRKAIVVAPSCHQQVLGLCRNLCRECGASFPTQSALRWHAADSRHSPFECSCGVRFSRLDTLKRHFNSFREDVSPYPCDLCKHHKGKNGFKRRDHLVQHLSGYHGLDEEEIRKHRLLLNYKKEETRNAYSDLICPYVGCEYHRGKEYITLSRDVRKEQRPFNKESDYKKHLKYVHGEAPFSCQVAGCDRAGRKGYLREKDLIKHFARQHVRAPEYLPVSEKWEPWFRCVLCEKSFTDLDGLRRHSRCKC